MKTLQKSGVVGGDGQVVRLGDGPGTSNRWLSLLLLWSKL